MTSPLEKRITTDESYLGTPDARERNAQGFFIGGEVSLSRLAEIFGPQLSVSNDGASLIWVDNQDRISLRLAPTQSSEQPASPVDGVWISGVPFATTYETDENPVIGSKLLGRKGDFIAAEPGLITIINQERPDISKAINIHTIDAKGTLREKSLPTDQINNTLKEAKSGAVSYPDY